MIVKLLKVLNPRWHLIKSEIKNKHVGPYVERSSAGYTIAIICRGEQLLYTDENGALVFEISIPGKWVDAESSKKWDEKRSLSEGQRLLVIDRIRKYFETTQGFSINIIGGTGNFGVLNES